MRQLAPMVSHPRKLVLLARRASGNHRNRSSSTRGNHKRQPVTRHRDRALKGTHRTHGLSSAALVWPASNAGERGAGALPCAETPGSRAHGGRWPRGQGRARALYTRTAPRTRAATTRHPARWPGDCVRRRARASAPQRAGPRTEARATCSRAAVHRGRGEEARSSREAGRPAPAQAEPYTRAHCPAPPSFRGAGLPARCWQSARGGR